MCSTRNRSVRSTWRAKESKTHNIPIWKIDARSLLYATLSRVHCTPPVSYLAAETGSDQCGHYDHGDNDLDGGGNGSHVECKFPVDQCKRDEVSNYELREGKGDRSYWIPQVGSIVVAGIECWLARRSKSYLYKSTRVG
jgi:hypothetical protein